jgi:hypothetical protein
MTFRMKHICRYCPKASCAFKKIHLIEHVDGLNLTAFKKVTSIFEREIVLHSLRAIHSRKLTLDPSVPGPL